MTPVRNILLVAATSSFALLAALAVAPLVAQPARNRAVATAEELPRPELSLQAIGARSCASTACHGSVHPDPRSQRADSDFIRRDEYIVWMDRDPHARSLRTLETEPARKMFEALGIKNATGEIIDQRGYNNCLNCHGAKIRGEEPDTVAFESINCESCHGPAEQWRDSHYRAGWSRAASTGFIDNKQLSTRSQSCAKCHVGAADREVNHDLIAAGHPVLKFDLAAYHEMLPKHWNDVKERATTKDFERALWNAGKLACELQALDLLAARVERQVDEDAASAAPVTPVWPEFAEYDCFACHQDLSGGGYALRSKDAPALPAWSPWYFAEVLPEVEEIATRMTHMPRVADDELLQAVQAARQTLVLHREPRPPSDPEQVAAQWDRAVQAYLRLAAEFRNRQDQARLAKTAWPEERAIKGQLLELRQALAFPAGYDSPAFSSTSSVESEARRALIAELIGKLQTQLLPGSEAP